MITNKLPFLLPLRVAQRKLFFYTGMRLDGNTYTKTRHIQLLPHKLFSASSGLYNTSTGFDMIYQENKVYNLKLASRMLNSLLIKPGETFSLWQMVRNADKHIPYKDGLVVKNGKLCVSYGGGLCQLSNLLFWLFLHTPLTILERHTHKIKDFPTLRDSEPEGVDATISEGWLDLKVKNETDITFQISIMFDSKNITGSLYSDKALPFIYKIEGKDLLYFRRSGKVYQKITIFRHELALYTQEVLSEKMLYENLCEIGYQLPDESIITDIPGVMT